MKTNSSKFALLLGILFFSSSWFNETIFAATFDVSRDFLTTTNPKGRWSYGWKSTLNGTFGLLPYHGAESDPGGGIWEHWFRTTFAPSSVYRNSGTATLFSDDGQGVYPPGTVWFGPGPDANPDNFVVIRFTVPISGNYKLTTVARSRLNGAIGGDTDFHLLHNDAELLGQNLPPDSMAGYTNTLNLIAGDTIDFAAGRGLDGHEYGGA